MWRLVMIPQVKDTWPQSTRSETTQGMTLLEPPRGARPCRPFHLEILASRKWREEVSFGLSRLRCGDWRPQRRERTHRLCKRSDCASFQRERLAKYCHSDKDPVLQKMYYESLQNIENPNGLLNSRFSFPEALRPPEEKRPPWMT